MSSKPKTGLNSVSEGTSDLFKIDPRKLNIRPNWNARDWASEANQAHLAQLAASIARVGVKQPLTVFWEDGRAWVDDGECRLRAVMQCIEQGIEIKAIPCRSADRLANEVERRFNRYLANTGKQFSDIELATDWKWFINQGWSQTDIAEKAGISAGRVSQILDLLTHPEGVKKMISNGEVSSSLAATVVKDHGGTKAEQMLKEGLQKAQDEGKTKVKPTHIEGAKPNLKTAVKDAFEYSDVNDEAEDMVVITMPLAHWDVIKNLLKL